MSAYAAKAATRITSHANDTLGRMIDGIPRSVQPNIAHDLCGPARRAIFVRRWLHFPGRGRAPAFSRMAYAIISVGGKQYRVQEGERVLVDRVAADEGKTLNPRVLLVGGDGKTDLAPTLTVTARVVGHVKGEKIRIGKYRKRTGYKRHTGFRASLTELEIERIGSGRAASAAKAEPAPKAAAAADHVAGMPKGYEELTVAQIAEAAPRWRRPQLEAALEFEQGHAKRKGAVAALESALAAKEDK